MKTKSNLNYKKAWDQISQAKKIFLSTHEATDGDDLGSLLALRIVLQKMGKETFCIVNGGVPNSLKFLPGSNLVTEEFENRPYDLIITFGCNALTRTGFDALQSHPAVKINFDHHPDNKMFGDVNVVEPETAAVAEMIFYFLNSNSEVEIDHDVATCLLTGIFTDTGGFQHSNTSAQVYEVAAELMRRGARIDKISHETFGNKRPQTLRAWARALENTRFDPEKKMAFSVMTAKDLQDTGAQDEDLTGFVTILNHIPQAKFALLLRQDGNVVKGSLRSDPHKNTDVSQIAKFFGGGGHKYASGFKIPGSLEHGESGWQIVASK
jgi:phosphoesterase RecJ-like protein